MNKEIKENMHVKIAREQGIEIGKEQNKKMYLFRTLLNIRVYQLKKLVH